jgi:hypothetical protein
VVIPSAGQRGQARCFLHLLFCSPLILIPRACVTYPLSRNMRS